MWCTTQWNTTQPLKKNNAICSNMDGPRYYHTKSEGQTVYHTTYMWNLKYDTNEPIYDTKQNQRHREQTGDCQGRRGWKREDVEVWD